jgi:hypothetical protein
MCVQPNAVGPKALPYIVLYCLTPAQFHRYSSLTLCTPYPAWGAINDGPHRASIKFGGEESGWLIGNAGENPHVSQMRRDMGHPIQWQLADNRPLFLRSSRCSN